MAENRQLDADFVEFVAEEVKNVKSPMILTHLCREFKKKSGTILTNVALLCRLRRIRDKMSEMENFDIGTKVKMMFALGAPVGDGFIIELNKQADIELDENHRIIKYKKNGEGLQLSGEHTGSNHTCDTELEKRMMKFLAEKSGNAISPMTDATFLKEFNSSVGNLKKDASFIEKYNLLKQHIYLAPEFDDETKIKMLFVSSTKVHASILEELRRNAVVEVDDRQRITKYKANDGSLELKGEHETIRTLPCSQWTKPETDKLENFIAEKSKTAKVPLFVTTLSREFVETNGNCRTMQAVKRHIKGHLLPKIPKLDNFDIETRMRMLFAFSVPVSERFLNELRMEAVVEVDEYQRITYYEANDGSLKLESVRFPPPTKWSKQEKDKLWNFLAEKSKQTKVPLLVKHLSREFVEKNKILRTMQSVELYIHHYIRPEISKLHDLDVETKMRMMFALRVSVDEEFLNKLREKAFVKIDKKRRIKKYEAKDGSLELTRDRSMPAKTKAGRVTKNNISGFYDGSEINEEPNDDGQENKEGEENDKGEGTEDKGDEKKHVEKEVSEPNTKSGKIPTKQLSDNHFFSDSDDNSWESSENAKKLKNSKKEKATREHRNIYFSETDDEAEEDDSGEEYEDEETNSFVTRSGKISKKRYPNADFSCEFDVSLDFPENVENSKIEKENEELIEKSMSSSRRVPLVENLKRKIVNNPSHATSKSKKSRKYERVSNTLNETESEKIAGETKQNDGEEVINDGTVETLSPAELPIKQGSLSYEQEKLENEEYKPDQTFLSNTTQDAMQNLSGTKGNHTEDVHQSPENTEEMTSGMEFMKLLRGLVTTLDSTNLVELQSKIDNEIEKFGNEDHKIPTEEIVMTLNTGLIILNKSASTIKPPTGESTSLRDFFFILRSTLSFFHSSSFAAFDLNLKENIRKLNSQDKIIPIETIRPVLETVLLLAMP